MPLHPFLAFQFLPISRSSSQPHRRRLRLAAVLGHPFFPVVVEELKGAFYFIIEEVLELGALQSPVVIHSFSPVKLGIDDRELAIDLNPLRRPPTQRRGKISQLWSVSLLHRVVCSSGWKSVSVGRRSRLMARC
jgi:hypothetical protein